MTKPLVGSFTLLSSYLNCPEQMRHRYILKSTPYVETPEMKRGNEVHSAFEHRLASRKPLPADMQQWEGFALPFDGRFPYTEEKLGITSQGKATGFFDSDCWFRGKADAVIVKGDTAYLADWKTGKSTYEHPLELATGALLVKARFPQVKRAFGQYVWLKENRLGQRYDLSDFEATFEKIKGLMEEIGNCIKADDWKKKPSGLCGWCDVKSCEHRRERR